MRKWRKQLASLLVLTMVGATFVGCGGSSTESGSNAAKTEVKKDEANTATEGTTDAATEVGDSLVPSQPTEVTFWHSISGDKEVVLKELVDEYNAGQGAAIGVTINPIFQGSYDEFSTKLSVALQSGDTDNIPDIVQLSSKGIFDVKDSEYLYSVQNLIDKDPNGINPATINEASAAYCMYNDGLLGVPFSTSSIMMYYNKDHFTAAGLDPEAPPTTLAELATAVDKLTVKSGNKIERFGLGTKLRFFILGTWVPSLGEGLEMFNESNGRTGVPNAISMTKDGSLETILTEWNNVLATGGVEYTDAGPNKSFLSGYYSIMFAATSSLTNVIESAAGNFEVGVAELPRVLAGTSKATGVGGSALYMFNRGSEDSLLATWDFIKFLSTPEASSKWFMNTGYYPMNMEAMNSDDVKALIAEIPQYSIITTILENSAGYTDYTEPWIPSFTDSDNLVQDEIIKFSEGQQDIATTIQNIDTGVTKKLDDYLSVN